MKIRDTRPYSVKLTKLEHSAAFRLVIDRRYKSLSDVLRTGLLMLLRRHKISDRQHARIQLDRLEHKTRRRDRMVLRNTESPKKRP